MNYFCGITIEFKSALGDDKLQELKDKEMDSVIINLETSKIKFINYRELQSNIDDEKIQFLNIIEDWYDWRSLRKKKESNNNFRLKYKQVAFIMKEYDKNEFEVFIWNKDTLEFRVDRLDLNGITELEDCLYENFRITKDRVQPEIIGWKKEISGRLKALRGKKYKNGVTVCAVNNVDIMLPALGRRFMGKKVYRSHADIGPNRNSNGYIKDIFNNITAKVYTSSNLDYNIDLLRMLGVDDVKENVVVSYLYKDRSIEFIVCRASLEKNKWSDGTIEIGKAEYQLEKKTLKEIMENRDSWYFKWRIDDSTGEYVIMTLCDVVRVAKSVTEQVENDLKQYRKLRSKVRLLPNNGSIALADNEGNLRIQGDILAKTGRGIVKVLGKLKRINKESFVPEYKNVDGNSIEPYADKEILFDLGHYEVEVETGYNIPMQSWDKGLSLKRGKRHHWGGLWIATENLNTFLNLIKGTVCSGKVRDFTLNLRREIICKVSNNDYGKSVNFRVNVKYYTYGCRAERLELSYYGSTWESGLIREIIHDMIRIESRQTKGVDCLDISLSGITIIISQKALESKENEDNYIKEIIEGTVDKLLEAFEKTPPYIFNDWTKSSSEYLTNVIANINQIYNKIIVGEVLVQNKKLVVDWAHGYEYLKSLTYVLSNMPMKMIRFINSKEGKDELFNEIIGQVF